MLRKILVTYEFIFNGISYQAHGAYIGDTSSPKTAKNKDYSADVICMAFKMSTEELAKVLGVKYWDMTKSRLEIYGFKFHRLDIDFFPKIKPGES